MKTIIFILILVLALARFTVKGLFNRKWREKGQEIFDNIKNERVFWSLLDGFNGMEFDPKGVLSLYLISLKREITNRDALYFRVSGRKPLLKNLINKKNGTINNIDLLHKAIGERDAFIKKYIVNNEVVFTDTEMQEAYGKIEDDLKSKDVPRGYQQFVREKFDAIIQGEVTGLTLWTVLKEIKNKESEFQYDKTGYKMINPYTLTSLMLTQTFINETVADLFCKRMENNDDFPKIQKALAEWRQLHILQWFVLSLTNWQKDYKEIQLLMWRIIESVC
jgi:hypothetical protein